jgi:hypothetical protein
MDMVDPFEQRIQRFQLILLLQSLKQVFDLDRQFCLITIAVSLQQHETADLAVAYERVLELAKKRKLADETITDKLNITGLSNEQSQGPARTDEFENPGNFRASRLPQRQFVYPHVQEGDGHTTRGISHGSVQKAKTLP